MSSFVAEFLVIRALLDEHRRHNLEYAAVAPFQTAFSTLFQARDGFAVNIEQSVDGGRARVDLWIRGLDYQHLTLQPMVVGEMKGSYMSPADVENQVLRRAQEAINPKETICMESSHSPAWGKGSDSPSGLCGRACRNWNPWMTSKHTFL